MFGASNEGLGYSLAVCRGFVFVVDFYFCGFFILDGRHGAWHSCVVLILGKRVRADAGFAHQHRYGADVPESATLRPRAERVLLGCEAHAPTRFSCRR